MIKRPYVYMCICVYPYIDMCICPDASGANGAAHARVRSLRHTTSHGVNDATPRYTTSHGVNGATPRHMASLGKKILRVGTYAWYWSSHRKGA